MASNVADIELEPLERHEFTEGPNCPIVSNTEVDHTDTDHVEAVRHDNNEVENEIKTSLEEDSHDDYLENSHVCGRSYHTTNSRCSNSRVENVKNKCSEYLSTLSTYKLLLAGGVATLSALVLGVGLSRR